MHSKEIGEVEFRVEDCLSQLELLDRRVQAWEHVDRPGALQRARELDHARRHGPLHGMPIGIKDIIDVGGMPTRCGSPIYAANLAQLDAACVTLARAAGAVIIGKTVTTELATFVPSRTRNPQNLDHTPGGSSSGSAAAVAAGMVPIAFGTQTAGSILRPAAYCGVVGYKPSFSLVPRSGVKLQSETLDTVGTLARTVEDARRFYLAMAGAMEYAGPAAVDHALRINVVTNWLGHAEVEMSVAITEAAETLAAAGCRVREIRLPAIYDEAQGQQRTVQLVENARHYALEMSGYRAQLDPRLAAQLTEGAAIPADDYLDAISRLQSARKQTDFLFADCDAWLMPSAPGAAPQGLESTGDPVFNRLATAMHLPAINIPVLRNKNRMPLGLQLIGSRHQDEKLLAGAQRVVDILRARHE